jgi:hypothetical protein
MKNTFFSPTGQCFVASNTNCLVQFLSGHLGSPDETDLDTVHQTEMAPFRKPKTVNNLTRRTSFCAEPKSTAPRTMVFGNNGIGVK